MKDGIRKFRSTNGHAYLSGKLYLGEYGSTIGIKLCLNSNTNEGLIRRALEYKDGYHVVVEGRLYVSELRGKAYVSINADSIT